MNNDTTEKVFETQISNLKHCRSSSDRNQWKALTKITEETAEEEDENENENHTTNTLDTDLP